MATLPEAVLFDAYLKLCEATSTYAEVYYLYLDLKGDMMPSPDSVNTLSNYYDGDMTKLEAKYKRARTDCNELYLELKMILQNAGLSVENGHQFVRLLIQPQDKCDFRTKVRDWSRAELRKMEKGKTSTPYDFGAFIERYNALVLKRQSKKNDTRP